MNTPYKPRSGIGAAADHRQPLGTVAAADDPVGAIPHDPRTQLGKLVGRVAAREHVEHALELGQRQIPIGVGAADDAMKLIHLPLVHRSHGNDLLCQHVQRAAGHAGVLDLALQHPPGDDRGLEQVAAKLGEEPARRGLADVVAGTSDPLQAGGDRFGRLDLHHQIDRAHVDTQLERRGGDQRRQPPGLEQILDLEPLLAGQRAVVRPGDVLLAQLVEPVCDPLGRAPAVDEDDGGAMCPHQLQQPRIDGGPDRDARLALHLGSAAELAHVLDRHEHLDVELLAPACVDDRDLTADPAEEGGDLLQRPLGGRQADALDVAADQMVEPLQREHQVGAALGGGDRVDLVDDHRLDARQRLAGRRGQHQVERLGRGDQDVGRVPAHRGALALRRVAGAHRHRDVAVGVRSRPAAPAGSSRCRG